MQFTRQASRYDGLSVVPLVTLLGAGLGLVEGLRELAAPLPPPGAPGATGPVLLAYVALGACTFGVPALLGAFLSAFAAPRLRVVLTVFSGVFPTALVFLDHGTHRFGWPGFAAEVGGLAHVSRVGGGAFVLAIAAGLLAHPFGRRWCSAVGRRAIGPGLVFSVGAVVALAWYLRLPPSPAATNETLNKPNVLLLTIDTLRQDALGAYHGRDESNTPHLDEIFARGVTVDGWSPAAWTMPAMAALFSGVGPTGNGAVTVYEAVYDSVEWWPERLTEAGYLSQAFATNPHLTRRFGFDRGFAGYEHADEIERLEPIAQSVWSLWISRQMVDRRDRYRGDRRVGPAIRWLTESAARQEAPWFLWVHLMDAHLPYHLRGPAGEVEPEARPAWLEPLVPELERGAYRDFKGARHGEKVTTKAEQAALKRLYETEVAFADWHSGRLFDAAFEVSGDRPLLWVVTSDHGEEFWDHGGFEHGHSLFGEILRVPMAMGGSQLPAGGRIGGMKLQDVGPTLLSLLELDPFDPLPSSGLADLTAQLSDLAVGRDRSLDLLGATSNPVECSATPLVAESLLFGPPLTRVLTEEGASLLRDDTLDVFVRVDVCTDALEQELQPGALPGADEAATFEAVDRWRARVGRRGPPVEVDAELEARLRALGYLR